MGRRGKVKERSEENRGYACENEREVKKGRITFIYTDEE